MRVERLLDTPLRLVPDRVAVAVGFDEQATFADVSVAMGRCETALRARGAGRGDRVAVLDDSGVLCAVAIVGAARCGASAALMNPRLTVPELRQLVTAAGGAALGIAGDAWVQPLAQVVDGPVLMTRDLAAPAPDSGNGQPALGDGDAVVLFTSGTTGRPKAVPIGHGTLSRRLDALSLPLDPDAPPMVRLICVPVFHVGGLVGLLRNLACGITSVVQPRFDAGEWLRLIEHHRVNAAFVVPTMLRRILDHPARSSTDLSSLTSITYGAAPAAADLVARALAAFPGVSFANTFGQTETLGGITALNPEDHHDAARLGSVGRPVDGVVIRIVEPSGGADVTPGEVGELLVLSPQNVISGWQRTGDLVRQDVDGYLYVAGRVDELINRGGEKFSPDEIESVIRSHPTVVDAAVAGVPDAEMGQRVGAAVVASAALTQAELLDHCRASLARFKLPELIVFVDELPVNALDKVVRNRVAALLGAHLPQTRSR